MNSHIFVNRNGNTLMHRIELTLDKSHYLCDYVQMMSTNFAAQAMSNDELWNTINHHGELFTSMNGANYTPDIKRIKLLPPNDVINDCRNNYRDIQSFMIYHQSKT